MKKALRILIPILLILVVLGSIVWYLLVYDAGFTKDMLLRSARHFERKGNHTAAVQIYNLAYLQAEDKQDVAIELADHFKSMGNFTQAERTLSEAIADGPTTELYIELCKTFVEQDKLLDAAALLDNVSDSKIKAQLESQRPAAPVVTPEPGFYNQYISLDFLPAGGALYVTTDGDYPSVLDEPFTEPLTLSAGETKLHAIVVGENGLVSPVTTSGFTVVGVIEPVTFRDPAVEAALRELLSISAEDPVYTDDLWQIESFEMPADAVDYSDLSGLINLKTLVIHQGQGTDFSFLSALGSLRKLEIVRTSLSPEAMNSIGQAHGLESLTLKECGISGIDSLQSLTTLTSLDLSGNSIRDLDALSGMTGLRSLYLQHNAISSLQALQPLQALSTLNVAYNSLSSLAPISKASQMQWLSFSNNHVADLTILKNFPALTHLYAGSNGIENASAVVTCLNLEEADLSRNKITDIAGFSSLEVLVKLNIAYNAVTALPAWAQDCALAELDASYNDIDTVEPLYRLHNLTRVNLDYNNRIETLDPLADCHRLMQVDAYGTHVTDVTALTDHGIIVNFNPTEIPNLEPLEPEEEEI